MTSLSSTTSPVAWIAVDIAKFTHQILRSCQGDCSVAAVDVLIRFSLPWLASPDA